MNKKIILSIVFSLMIPMIMLVNANPTIGDNGKCFVEEPILLYEGWNLIALYWNNGSYPLTGDRNVSVVEGLNLLGNSGVNSFELKDITFTNDTNTYSYINSGLSDISVLRDGSSETLVYNPDFILNPKTIYPQEGFWITSTSEGNITLPNVGGVEVGVTFDWDKLRFRNSSGVEKNVTDASISSWIDTTYIEYWNTDVNDYRYVCSEIYDGPTSPVSADCLVDSFNSYQGYFINSLENNITLIRQNTTEPCKIKPKCKAKFIGSDGKCKFKVKAKFIGSVRKFRPMFKPNHAIRYLGRLKNFLTI